MSPRLKYAKSVTFGGTESVTARLVSKKTRKNGIMFYITEYRSISASTRKF